MAGNKINAALPDPLATLPSFLPLTGPISRPSVIDRGAVKRAFMQDGPHRMTVSRLGATLALAMLASVLARAEKLVTVRSVADRAYAARRAAANPPPTETYVFAKGQFSAGVTHDPGLEKLNFMSMARTLAVDLKKQHFEPAKDVGTADVIIVVHWGVTLPNDRGVSLFANDPEAINNARRAVDAAFEQEATEMRDFAAGGPPPVSTMLGLHESKETDLRRESQLSNMMYAGNESLEQSNAELLGFSSALAKEEDRLLFESALGETLRKMSDEERYFIILMAYDAKELRAGRKHRLWVTRMSIRSAGVNFPMAIDRMSGAAALIHATRQTGIALEIAKDRPGTVKIGELKVIGEAPESPAKLGKP